MKTTCVFCKADQIETVKINHASAEYRCLNCGRRFFKLSTLAVMRFDDILDNLDTLSEPVFISYDDAQWGELEYISVSAVHQLQPDQVLCQFTGNPEPIIFDRSARVTVSHFD